MYKNGWNMVKCEKNDENDENNNYRNVKFD